MVYLCILTWYTMYMYVETYSSGLRILFVQILKQRNNFESTIPIRNTEESEWFKRYSAIIFDLSWTIDRSGPEILSISISKVLWIAIKFTKEEKQTSRGNVSKEMCQKILVSLKQRVNWFTSLIGARPMKLIKVNSTSNVLGCFYFSSRFAASSTRLFRTRLWNVKKARKEPKSGACNRN